MRARNVLLALLIIAAGMTITASHQGVFARWEREARKWTGDFGNLADLVSGSWVSGNWQERKRHSEKFDAKGLSSIAIQNVNGRVTVTGEERENIVVKEILLLREGTSSVMHRRPAGAVLSNERSDGLLNLRVVGFRRNWASDARIDLEISAPPGLDVSVNTTSGPVEVCGMKKAVEVSTVSGEVSVEGGSEAEVSSASGSAVVRDIDGPAQAKSISGSLTVDNISGEAKFSTVSGSIRASDLRGPVAAKSISGSVVLDRCAGSPVTVNTTSGDQNVSFTAPLTGRFRAHSVSGSVFLTLPKGSDCRVSVSTLSGKTTWGVSDFTAGIPDRERGRRISGVMGSGRGRLEIDTVSGSLTVLDEGTRFAPATRPEPDTIRLEKRERPALHKPAIAPNDRAPR